MIERFASGGPWEASFGYSRAVRCGDLVLVSGTTAVSEDGVVLAIGDPAGQLHAAIGRAHGERFGAAAPVSTMVQVAALIDPRMLVEIEAVAYVGPSGS